MCGVESRFSECTVSALPSEGGLWRLAAADFWRESAARRGERCVSDARCDPGGAHVAEEEHGGWRLQGCRQSLVLGSATTRLQFVVALHGVLGAD